MSDALGRGLGSLIPKKTNGSTSSPQVSPPGEALISSNIALEGDKDKVLQIDPEKIEVNPMQPRQNFSDFNLDELVESIREYGIIQPLIVTRHEGKYELIAGERRLRAAKKLKLKKVPVVVRDESQQRKLEIALVENLQREDLNPIETAHAYKKLMDEFDINQEEVAFKVGKSRSSIANTLRMMKLPEEIQLALVEGRISEGHAKYLIGLEGETKQLAMFKRIVNSGLTVAETGKEIRKIGGTKKSRIKENLKDQEKEHIFREFFGTKVEIRRNGSGGQVVVDFYSDEELADLTDKVKIM